MSSLHDRGSIAMTTEKSAAVFIVPKDDTEEPNFCIRTGCTRQATRHPDWEDEYCSAECVVAHCKNIFNQWCKTKREAEEKNK
ncbi:Hypothetical predicted protein [Cloeon dipterum]|uniref:Uncharacterized protein n=1 Tax=Cloeon dipterum TaxID=197152 RepID=A0A8S1CLY0_9INSE|nr:Hypothetical predicted protein [Cloeon dipterum]